MGDKFKHNKTGKVMTITDRYSMMHTGYGVDFVWNDSEKSDSIQGDKLSREFSKLTESTELEEISEGFNGFQVRKIAEEVVRDHGGNNSVGKYDKYINAMHSLFRETLLTDKAELKKAMEGYWNKYN